MLTDITLLHKPDPISQILRMLNGGARTRRMQRGVYLCGHWNFEREVMEPLAEFWKRDKPPYYMDFPVAFHKRYPVRMSNDDWGTINTISEYGVCDSPEQLLDLYNFEDDTRKLVISMVEVRRERQPPEGGWRYHKWGPYIGEQNPRSEYLYHDNHIERVFTYNIYQVEGEGR